MKSQTLHLLPVDRGKDEGKLLKTLLCGVHKEVLWWRHCLPGQGPFFRWNPPGPSLRRSSESRETDTLGQFPSLCLSVWCAWNVHWRGFGVGPKRWSEHTAAVLLSAEGVTDVFTKGWVERQRRAPAFLLNRGLSHTNRHKFACCLNRILVMITYPTHLSWCGATSN